MADSTSLTTGVDQLIALVSNKKKISVGAAAKQLHVPRQTVDEWATLLEDSGFIKIEYGLTQVNLVKRSLSPKEQKVQESQLKLDKHAFDAASEGMITYLDRFEQEIMTLKELIDSSKVKKMVPKELKKLKELEQRRDDIDKNLVDAKRGIIVKVRKLQKHLEGEQKQVKETLDRMIDEIVSANSIIGLENKEMAIIQRNEKVIDSKLAKLSKLIDKSAMKIEKKKERLIGPQRVAANVLLKHAKELKIELANDRKKFNMMMNESKKRTAELQKLHKQIIREIKAQQGRLYGKTKGNLQNFLKQRMEVSGMLTAIYNEEQVLKDKLMGMVGRGRVVRIGKPGFDIEIKSLSKEFNYVSKRRDELEKNLRKIAAKLK